MDPLALGVSYPDGSPLFSEVSTDELIARLTPITADAKRLDAAPWTFDVREPIAQARLDVPAEAGWTYVVADDDDDRDGIVAALEPLAHFRGMAEPSEPLRLPAGADRGDWIDETYRGLGDQRPRYVLLAGGPTKLSFPFQVDLAAAGAMVGRVAFSGEDRLDAYGEYAAKVVRCENTDRPAPRAAATVVATDGGPLDATTFSKLFLAPPIVKHLEAAAFRVTQVRGSEATKEGLRSALRSGQPALVFTATHGAGQAHTNGGVDPRKTNGAWACAPGEPGKPLNAWDWLTVDDLPTAAVTPGGVVVQFACFGYGTTDRTSYAAWLGNRNVVEVPEPFIAAIPQRLLANPDGPVAYVGHVDVALAHGFVDPAAPGPSPRIEPFLWLVGKSIVDRTPIGYALTDLHGRAAGFSSEIAQTFDALTQQNLRPQDLPEDEKESLIDKVIRRNDAMHFLLLGDPAVRVRIWDE